MQSPRRRCVCCAPGVHHRSGPEASHRSCREPVRNRDAFSKNDSGLRLPRNYRKNGSTLSSAFEAGRCFDSTQEQAGDLSHDRRDD